MPTAMKNVPTNTITVIASRSASVTALHIRGEVYQKGPRLRALLVTSPQLQGGRAACLPGMLAKPSREPHFVGTITNQAQPPRKQRPPIGVPAPSQRKFVS